ncbi:hypothetical protein HMPREF1138_0845 [Actinomyces sp. ICM58]|uniref:DUF6318 family protein n=1 Tax=Actinomyces sp. ICM58 TaxID=1105030 RepID=UPI0002771BF0|nr:DUF6318 family protein [Actinomyces sp. ICM58]EJN51357.1 hypothetical protein HMPREF1138_0845 [Actinomyces sp. ICM58]
MMVPPLSERPVTEEDEEQFRRETAPRKYTLRRRWADYRAEVKARRPKGARARARAWLHVEPFYWGMRVVYVVLFAGAVLAVYINGVAEGWWPAWGEKPTVAATTTPPIYPTPTASATASGEAAMSGGYQIGPDGVLVRPAEHAASTYTKPELPEEAKENTEKGAEAAARHYLALIVYAWNTGDTQPLADMSDPSSNFAQGHIANTQEMYTNGWSFGNSATVQEVLRLEAVAEQDGAIPPNTIGVRFLVSASNGTRCKEQSIVVDSAQHSSTITLFMTWKNNRWTELQGSARDYDDE